MSSIAVAADIDPLDSPELRRRFPRLEQAMNTEFMTASLQRTLFAGREIQSLELDRPKAEVGEHSCWLQYELRLHIRAGEVRDTVVLGVLFSDAADASRYEREHLRGLAARARFQGEAPPRATAVLAEASIALSVFPVCGALPTLVDATHPGRVSSALRALLRNVSPAVRSVELVELRRSRGCVLRYVTDSPDLPVVYGKVGYAGAGNTLPDGIAALAKSVAGGGRHLRFPRALGHSSELDLTLVAELPGQPADLRVAEERRRAVDAGGLVAATLHGSGVSVGAPHSLEDELGRAASVVQLVSRDAPVLGGRLASILAAAALAGEATPAQALSFAHGSLAPSQLIFDGSHIGVLDLDRLCQAEPAFDVGRFLAPLRVTLAKYGFGDEADALAARFVESYRAEGGQVTPQARIDVYEIVSLVRMCGRSWLQLKASRFRHVWTVLQTRAMQAGLV
ncbi:MAG TPA: phosphotransferase [Candidatus Acidoferrales bacterium]|nr:phosphotransferase [Candidatus Acidoferrales bacterium]